MHEAYTIPGLMQRLEERGSRPALINVRGGVLDILSGEVLAKRSQALARQLQESGTKPGEPVALIAPNGFEWVIARFAIATANAMAVPIDDAATDTDIQAILSGCKATQAICTVAKAKTLKVAIPNLRILALGDGPLPEGVARFEYPPCATPSVSAEAPDTSPAMLAYTSGTTGAPKAIVLTSSNIEANVKAMVDAHLVGPADRVLLPLPLHHIYPFVAGLLAPLASGSTVVFPASATGPDMLEAIRAADVSAIVGVPRLYSAMIAGLLARMESRGPVVRTLSWGALHASAWFRRATGMNIGALFFQSLRARFGPHLRLLVSGGARLEPETLSTLLALGFDVRSGYGLAETASMFTGHLPGSQRMGSEGKPFAGEMRIADPDPAGTGEIQLKGPQVFSSYLGNAEATHAAFTTDGWLRTGDLGHIDSDGYLYVTGRLKETLVLGGGKKINPEELERLYGNSRYIREIAIFENRGALAAIVVPALEAARISGAVHVDKAIHVNLESRARVLPSYQRISQLVLTREPLPRTRLGKIRRFLLPQIFERAQHHRAPRPDIELSEDDRALLKHPVANQIYEMLSKRYPQGKLALDASPLLDLGIDSLEWISLSLEIEDRLKVRLTEADIGNAVTVRDLLVAAIQAKSAPVLLQSGLAEWIAPTNKATALAGAMLYGLNRQVMRTLFGLRVENPSRFPDTGFVIIANHTSYLDAPALAAALSYTTARRSYWAGDPVLLFSKRWQRSLMRAVHGYPVAEHAPAEALAISSKLLQRGDNIVWFPEGWRSPDGQLQPFLPGIGHLLLKTPVPVVPAHIDGAFEAYPRDRRFPRLGQIRVKFGEPIAPEAWRPLITDKGIAPQQIADLLHNVVSGLAPNRAITDPHQTDPIVAAS